MNDPRCLPELSIGGSFDFSRNSGAGNGCADFMGAWHFWLFLLEKKTMPIKFLLLGGGGGSGFFRGGGGSANLIFMGVGIFPKHLNL